MRVTEGVVPPILASEREAREARHTRHLKVLLLAGPGGPRKLAPWFVHTTFRNIDAGRLSRIVDVFVVVHTTFRN